MKALKRLLCLALTFAALLSSVGCSSDSGDVVVATVNGENVYRWQVLNLYEQNKSYYEGIAGVDLDDVKNFNTKQAYYKELLDQLITNTVVYVNAKESGYDLTADEQKTAVDDDYKAFVERNVKYYAENTYKGDANAQEKAQKKLDEVLKENNLNEERIKLGLYRNAVSKKLTDKLTAEVGYDDAKLLETYNKRVEEQKAKYEQDPTAYENDAVTPQSLVFYSPPGFVRVKHILVELPKDTQSRIDKLTSQLIELVAEQQALVEQKGKDDATVLSTNKKIEDLQKDIETLRQQGMEQVKPQAEEVLAKVKDGIDFDMLVEQYGADPGMEQYPAKQYGYLLSADSGYVPAFKEAALALQNVGDTTGLVQSTYGYHIIKLIEKIAEGPTPFEKCKQLLIDVLSAPQKQQIISEYAGKVKADMKIEKFESRL